MRARHAVVALGLACAAGPSCSSERPPLGEALVVVDTDMPAPKLASRLRVDLYAEDGTWYASRDIGRPADVDWPASFSVFAPDDRALRVLVRLRVYPEAVVRDYRGELWLVANGLDVTPPSEPKPTATVDRLLLLGLEPGKRGRVSVVMRGACAGTSPLLAAEGETPVFGEAQTCTDTEGVVEPVFPSALVPDMAVPPPTARDFGTSEPCEETTASSRAICVPGGAFVLGSRAAAGATGVVAQPVPERVVVMSRFWLDRHEVTVGDVRKAYGAGFAHGDAPPGKHEGTLGQPSPGDVYPFDRYCTFSTAERGREDLPFTCGSWAFARRLCAFRGGDLPSEAQYEYVSSSAGKPFKTDYPWGNEPPTCDRLAYGSVSYLDNNPYCPQFDGPVPVTTPFGDVTPLGVLGLAGNVAEILKDELAEYTDACWRAAPLVDPVCARGTMKGWHVLRGSGFLFGAFTAHSSLRNDDGSKAFRSAFGFRCAFTEQPK